MMRVLVCEDERPIRELLVINLRRAGYDPIEASSGEEALRLFETIPDIQVVLLDVMLPGIDGHAVCEIIRRQSASVGIIMLTARSKEQEKIAALKHGADDYVTKPFSPSELLARVEALLRRVSGSMTSEIVSGDFTLNTRTHVLMKGDIPIELTGVEYQIMQFFMENPDRPLAREEILRHAWGQDYYGEDKVVDVNIRRLRMKVETSASNPRHIVTVWGTGYCWHK